MPTLVEMTNTGSYRQADQDHEYTYDSGVVVLPVASRTAAFVTIQLHGPIGKRTVRWTHSRDGKPPVIPVMQSTSGDTFIKGSVTPSLPRQSTTNSGYNWTVRGEYVYVQNNPRLVGTNPLPVGQQPFLDLNNALFAGTLFAPQIAALGSQPTFNQTAEALGNSLSFNGGDYSWPVLALPTAFTSDHILQD